jgi:hypothetical protein
VHNPISYIIVENVDGVTRQSPSSTSISPLALQADASSASSFSTAALAGNKNVRKIKKDDTKNFM